MKLLNKKVTHKKFGEGIVTSENKNGQIEIQFKDGIHPFNKNRIEGFLTFLDEPKPEKSYSQTTKSVKIIDTKINHNIAFKCTYCDGGKENNGIGFDGMCSQENVEYNLKNNRSWCTLSDCAKCSRDELIKMNESRKFLLCYEAELLKKWIMGAGVDTKGNPKKIRQARQNSLCILTTEFPKETERKIFGVFLINCIVDGEGGESFVEAQPEYTVSLTREEAEQLNYWDFNQNDNAKTKNSLSKWVTGLFRYVSDMNSAKILKSICSIKKDTEDFAQAEKIFDYYCSIKNIRKEDIVL